MLVIWANTLSRAMIQSNENPRQTQALDRNRIHLFWLVVCKSERKSAAVCSVCIFNGCRFRRSSGVTCTSYWYISMGFHCFVRVSLIEHKTLIKYTNKYRTHAPRHWHSLSIPDICVCTWWMCNVCELLFVSKNTQTRTQTHCQIKCGFLVTRSFFAHGGFRPHCIFDKTFPKWKWHTFTIWRHVQTTAFTIKLADWSVRCL